MADVKISLTGDELTELRILLSRQAGKLDDIQTEVALRAVGYELRLSGLQAQLEYIAEKLYNKMR